MDTLVKPQLVVAVKALWKEATNRYPNEEWVTMAYILNKLKEKTYTIDSIEVLDKFMSDLPPYAGQLSKLEGELATRKLTVEERAEVIRLLVAYANYSDITKLAFGGFLGVLQEFKEDKCSAASVIGFFVDNEKYLKETASRDRFFNLFGDLSKDVQKAMWQVFRTAAINQPSKRFGPGAYNWDEETEAKMFSLLEEVIANVQGTQQAKKQDKQQANHENRLIKIRMELRAGKEPSKEDGTFLMDFGTEDDYDLLMSVLERVAQVKARKEGNLDAMEF